MDMIIGRGHLRREGRFQVLAGAGVQVLEQRPDDFQMACSSACM